MTVAAMQSGVEFINGRDPADDGAYGARYGVRKRVLAFEPAERGVAASAARARRARRPGVLWLMRARDDTVLAIRAWDLPDLATARHDLWSLHTRAASLRTVIVRDPRTRMRSWWLVDEEDEVVIVAARPYSHARPTDAWRDAERAIRILSSIADG